jgi:hypothetical protein
MTEGMSIFYFSLGIISLNIKQITYTGFLQNIPLLDIFIRIAP